MVCSNMTTTLMGPLEECRDTVARYDYPVVMPEVGLVPLPLFLVDQNGFQTLLWAFVDVPKLPQALELLESISRSDHGDVEVQVYIHTAEHLLG